MFLITHRLPPWPAGFSANLVLHVLDALSEAYAPWYAVNPLPDLYGSGIRYREDGKHGSGTERFFNPWQVAARGHGDCNDLVLYRLTELKARGEAPELEPDHTRSTWVGGDIHVLVRRADGSLEDPSVILLRRYGSK